MLSKDKAFKLIDSGDITSVDLRFTDLRGVTHHFTVPASEFDDKAIKAGFGFDGSSVVGFQEIHNSDLIVLPDTDAMFVDPFYEKMLVVLCDVYDPISREPYPIDPRGAAKRAEKYLKDSGIGDVSYWGPELEFFVFDELFYEVGPYSSSLSIYSQDVGSSLEDDGYKVRTKKGYFPAPPQDKLQAFRMEMVEILQGLGIEVEAHHHEVATAGQVEVDMKYDTLVTMADKMVIYKYVAKNLAKNYGMTVTFLPKPVFGDNGSGMHVHQSIFTGGKNAFFDKKGYAELSTTALQYTGGLLSNLPALLAFTNPTLNSYRRLVPNYEAPTAIAFSARNRSAAVRIPMYTLGEEKAKRLELRCPDPTANPYLALPAMLVYGISGVKGKLDADKNGFGPFEENIWEKKRVKQTPKSLTEALVALSRDKVLAETPVFPAELIESYVDAQMAIATEAQLYPTPADFEYYGDL